ncbi:MAG: FtsX-like permease family protein [Pseudomonadota bacterium]
MLELTLAYMRDRLLTTTLNIILLGLATATLIILLLFSTQLGDRLARGSANVDLVVGAKGSPLQLILSSLYQIDAPTGNIPFDAQEMLENEPAVAAAIPIAMGDNFRGFRIVGAEQRYLDLYDAEVKQGRIYQETSEVVIGADVARELSMGLGQRFVGSHGLADAGAEHDHAPMIVVGILARTDNVVDRLIVTPIESVWDAHGIHDHDHDDGAHGHEHHDEAHDHDHHDEAHDHDHNDEAHDHDHNDEAHDHDHNDEAHDDGKAPDSTASQRLSRETELKPEISALLIKYRNAALGATQVPRMINRQTEFQAAVPAVETARLLSLLGIGIDSVRLFAWLLALTGGLAIFIALLNAATEREGDLALLRLMGASKKSVFTTIVSEGLITAAAGGLLGLATGHIALWLASLQFDQISELGIDAWTILPAEIILLASIIAIGGVAAVIPAIRVFKNDLAITLARSA